MGHQSTHRGGRSIENINVVLINDITHTAMGGIAGHALKHQGSRTVGQGAINDIAVPGNPANVRGAPVDFTLLIVKHVLVGHGGVGQVAAGGVLQAFRRTGRTRGVENE